MDSSTWTNVISVIALIVSVWSYYKSSQATDASHRMDLANRRDTAANDSFDLNARVQALDYEISLLEATDTQIPGKRIALSGLKKQFDWQKSVYEKTEKELSQLESREPEPLRLETLLFPKPAVVNSQGTGELTVKKK